MPIEDEKEEITNLHRVVLQHSRGERERGRERRLFAIQYRFNYDKVKFN